MTVANPPPRALRDKLDSLLDYVAQVVRLDERVAFAVAEYRLPDGTAWAVRPADIAGLPGVRLDEADEGGPVWLAVERLRRGEPPAPPEALAPWVTVASGPERPPAARPQRSVLVDVATRLARIAAGACPDGFAVIGTEMPDTEDGGPPPAPSYRQTLCLADQPSTAARIDAWITAEWTPWAAAEAPRRRTIALYERLYRLLQLIETGGADAPVEVVWGIGNARWRHAGRLLDRPLLERTVDIELDEGAGGLLRVRPTVADAGFDLQPYEALGCANLGLLDTAIRPLLDAVEDGVSPFRQAGFSPVLTLAAARLHPDAVHREDETVEGERADATADDVLTLDDAWTLFARPRSAHVLLADIARLRAVARDPDQVIAGVAARLVSEPSTVAGEDWAPLSDTLGDSPAAPLREEPHSLATEVFFPKPFNDDQVEIVRRLAGSDGLVVQGPPGTGKTHTIANLICHAMATGQRVLVVSRGEAALAVLRDQLPEKVRPLAIALLSNERQGLAQVEAAIREVQEVVEGGRPAIRHAAIRRCEAEIVKLRGRLATIDAELDALAAVQDEPIGPRGERPAALARRVAESRPAHAWFTDRPADEVATSGLAEADIAALALARTRLGDLLDHREAELPAPGDVPDEATIAGWHDMIVHSGRIGTDGPLVMVATHDPTAATALADALDGLAALDADLPPDSWLRPLLQMQQGDRWTALLHPMAAEWEAIEGERIAAVAQAVEWLPGVLDDSEARAAIGRAARGERMWPLLSLGRGGSKNLCAAVRVRGAPVRDGDAVAWGAVDARLALADRERSLAARWRAIAAEAGASAGAASPNLLARWAAASRLARRARAARDRLPGLAGLLPPAEALATDPARARSVAAALRQAAEAARLSLARRDADRLRLLFEASPARTATMARRILDDVLGQDGIETARVAAAWAGVRALLGRVHAAARDFATVTSVTARIAQAGAPAWAARLRQDPATADRDPLIPADWAAAWDIAAADARLARLDARTTLASLANQRAEAERNVTRLFQELVRERTFYALEQRLSPSVKSALVEFVRALGRLGKGTGRGAPKQRRAARDAMRRCYAAVPCWIMPTWRVSEQLPADLAAFDLVILDEASQSDVTELPAILRGRKILVVGDDRQVSPMAPFVPQAKIDHLRTRFLRGLPFQSLLEPGESLYTLMQAVFPDARLMLKEHFRCVEPIIRFSMQFYPETLVPLRVPTAAERLDPPLIDILVPHGERDKGAKINRAEAAVIVEEIASLVATPGMEKRSIGVISLIGADQAAFIRVLLDERLGAETMQRHAVLCGDSATFQGNERDVVFLSMVADRQRRATLTMARYAQRFNVAMSRARDRVVLVRSVKREDLNPLDLKARLIAHFEQPMPVAASAGADPFERCDSDFERDVMRRLLGLGYRVEPQVGAVGFRIDLVVEDAMGRRLAVECDGDRFHGPGQWREDMRRQRVLERVGWRFWRCFASSFYPDPDDVMADLVATLTRAGIAPTAGAPAGPSPWVDHRVVATPDADAAHSQGELALHGSVPAPMAPSRATSKPAAVGDRLLLAFADDRRTASVLLTDTEDNWARGLVAVTSPAGQALLGREVDDEVALPFATGSRRAIVDRCEPGMQLAPDQLSPDVS